MWAGLLRDSSLVTNYSPVFSSQSLFICHFVKVKFSGKDKDYLMEDQLGWFWTLVGNVRKHHAAAVMKWFRLSVCHQLFLIPLPQRQLRKVIAVLCRGIFRPSLLNRYKIEAQRVIRFPRLCLRVIFFLFSIWLKYWIKIVSDILLNRSRRGRIIKMLHSSSSNHAGICECSARNKSKQF